MSTSFLYPMSILAFFTFCYGISMFFVRIHSVRRGFTDPRYFKLMKGEPSEIVVKTGQHFTNLFEVPVLFYVVCLAFISLHIFNKTAFTLAWIFVLARVAHAYVHTTHNRLYPRIAAFFLGVFSVLAMRIILAVEVSRG